MKLTRIIPADIAIEAANKVKIALGNYGCRDRAIAAIDEAFKIAAARTKATKITLDSPLCDLLSGRALENLERHGIHTVGDLVTCKPEYLCQGTNLGAKTVQLVEAILRKHGLKLETSL